MHFHLPKPLHGWREFAGEVGIIMLGVLLALGAEQAVEALHWSKETADAREALKAELDRDLGAIKFSQAHSMCLLARLNDLEKFVRSSRAGRPIRLTAPLSNSGGYSFHTNVWDIVKTGQTAAHMSLREKLDYAQIYDILDNLRTLRQTAREAQRELTEVTYGGTLNDADLRRMELNIQIVRSYTRAVQGNLDEIVDAVQRLDLKPDTLKEVNPDSAKAACKSILPLGSQKA